MAHYRIWLFLVIFLEGFTVLATELLVIRELVPFVGNDPGVISIIIAAVLMPLAFGYFYGGNYLPYYQKLYGRKKLITLREKLLRNFLSAFIILSLGLSHVIMELFFDLAELAGLKDRLLQTSLYSLLFVVYPVFLLGQTIPLISHYLRGANQAVITGRILFFSTVGSFLGAVFTTLILMTVIGVHHTVLVVLGVMIAMSWLISREWLNISLVLMLGFFGVAWGFNHTMMENSLGIIGNNSFNLVQIYRDEDGSDIMRINRSTSSKYSPDPEKRFLYIRYIEDHILSYLKLAPKKSILVIGAGGFTLGVDDTRNDYTYVDIDPDLKALAETHLLKQKLTPNKQFIASDARRFLAGTDKSYDIIVLDVYNTPISIPYHLVTREFLASVKKALKPNGVVVSNVICKGNFQDAFSVKYDRTFHDVFGHYNRVPVQPYNLFAPTQTPDINVLYIYHDMPQIKGKAYTDNKNDYFLDR